MRRKEAPAGTTDDVFKIGRLSVRIGAHFPGRKTGRPVEPLPRRAGFPYILAQAERPFLSGHRLSPISGAAPAQAASRPETAGRSHKPQGSRGLRGNPGDAVPGVRRTGAGGQTPWG